MTASSHPTPTDPIAPPGAIVVHVCARSDVGRTREHNEDAYLVADLEAGEAFHFVGTVTQRVPAAGTLFMVADGMGGAAAGEVASEMAVSVVLDQLRARLHGAAPTPREFAAALRGATEAANAAIHQYSAEHPELRGMGTTATLAGLLGDSLYLAQVGDSRAYLVRGGVARQITKDQSLMQKLIEAGELSEEEAEQSERRNIILQALGPDASIKIDLTHQPVRRGDVLVLCSDGLSNLVRPETIARAVNEEYSLDRVCDRLIATANDAGGPDNITVIAARFEGTGLDVPAHHDAVGHRVFGTPVEGTAVDQALLRVPTSPAVQFPAAPDGASPSANGSAPPTAGAATPPDPARRARGMRITRAILAVGIVIALLVIWRMMTQL